MNAVRRLLNVLIGAFLVLQVLWIVLGPLRNHSYLNWAPFHEHAWYQVDARLAGKSLGPDEIKERYRVYQHFYDERTGRDWQLNRMTHILGLIEVVERSLPKEQQAQVSVRYSVNGGEEVEWVWPTP